MNIYAYKGIDGVDVYLHGLGKAPRFSREEERLLWERSQMGDQEAYEQLYLSVIALAFHVVSKGGRDLASATADAHDAVTASLRSFKPGKGRLTTYVGKSAYFYRLRTFHNRVRRENREQNILYDEISLDSTSPVLAVDLVEAREDHTEQMTEEYNRQRWALWLLGKIPPYEKAAVGRVLVGKTSTEVAKQYGVTRERIRQVKIKGLKRLRALAEEFPFEQWSEQMADDNGETCALKSRPIEDRRDSSWMALYKLLKKRGPMSASAASLILKKSVGSVQQMLYRYKGKQFEKAGKRGIWRAIVNNTEEGQEPEQSDASI